MSHFPKRIWNKASVFIKNVNLSGIYLISDLWGEFLPNMFNFSDWFLVSGLVRGAGIYVYLYFQNILLYNMISLIRNMVLWDKTVEHNRKTKSFKKADSDLTKSEAML